MSRNSVVAEEDVIGSHAPVVGALLAFPAILFSTTRSRQRCQAAPYFSGRRHGVRFSRMPRRQAQAGEAGALPTDLYQLLGVNRNASASQIRSAFLQKQKVFHPDIAGENGAEMSALLNSAYTFLSNRADRQEYDQQLQTLSPGGNDSGPVWPWRPKMGKTKPKYDGMPRSRALWDRVPEEARGPRWVKQEFVFVDEFKCIGCWNCAATAPKTFAIEADNQRARVFAQWGDTEEDLNWAVMSCPVDCISWVTREQLQVLEHVTANYMHEYGSVSRRTDPFAMADSFSRRNKKRVELAAADGGSLLNARGWQARIQEVGSTLRADLKEAAGWK